jgi:hypothetical protein
MKRPAAAVLLALLLTVMLPVVSHATVLVERPRASTWIGPYPSAWLSPDGTDMDGQCWDSFLVPAASTLSGIEWWGSDTTGVEAFELSLWNDIGVDLQPYISAPKLASWEAPAPAGVEPDTANAYGAICHYRYTLPTTYSLQANTWYWLSVRARHYTGFPSWGWAVAINGDGRHFAQVGAFYAGDVSYTYQPNELAFRLLGPPPAGVSPRPEAGLALAGALPNPARASGPRLSYSLANDAPATLELLDVSGRRVARADVAGAGPHETSLAPSRPLAPGVYLARLAQGGAVRTARVVVVE